MKYLWKTEMIRWEWFFEKKKLHKKNVLRRGKVDDWKKNKYYVVEREKDVKFNDIACVYSAEVKAK